MLETVAHTQPFVKYPDKHGMNLIKSSDGSDLNFFIILTKDSNNSLRFASAPTSSGLNKPFRIAAMPPSVLSSIVPPSVSVQKHIESDESFVIQGRRPDSRRCRRCGRRKTALATVATSGVTRAIRLTRNGRLSNRRSRRPSAAATNAG